MTTPSSTDRIEKRITLRASPARVWQALASSREFGTWFEVELRGDFAPGATVRGTFTSPGHTDLQADFHIEAMERERLLSFRWHPHCIDPAADYSSEPTTLVELRLEPVREGTVLVVTESGFDRLPEARRRQAFESNSGGWEAQLRNIERYLADHVA